VSEVEPQQDETRTESSSHAANRAASRKGAVAYQGAMEAVLSILVGTGIGLWLDTKLATTPIFLLVGLAVGFGAFILRIVRLHKRLEETPESSGDE
jgi:F0F1-type ATP synthase assembly protein I